MEEVSTEMKERLVRVETKLNMIFDQFTEHKKEHTQIHSDRLTMWVGVGSALIVAGVALIVHFW